MRTTVTLAHPTDLAGFRSAARALLHAGIAPQGIDWFSSADAAADLFAAPALDAPSTEADAAACRGSATPRIDPPLPAAPQPLASARDAPAVRVPAAFLRQCAQLVLHCDPARFALMYRLLWRLTHESGLRHDPLDPDRLQADHMARAVAREQHKMHAFVRFRPVPQPDGQTLHVAWFEPTHFITEASAPFFVRRFTQMHWAILTPQASVRWDGQHLHTGPGAPRSQAPGPDAGEALWLTYYRHIFNPARLKLSMMQKEMPRRYWQNLPEAALISELAHSAHERTARMCEAPASTPRRRIPQADSVRNKNQDS